MNPQTFIEQIAPLAQTAAKRTGVLASITIAQAALESGWGESGLTKSGNNLFGIKADNFWRGETLIFDTKEFIKEQWIVVPAKWRKYPNWQASVDDHASFLKQNRRYLPCFSCLTADAFVKALAKAGYATDRGYADKVIAVIASHKLTSFDGVAT
jgi:flagellum-specific peptidoglycan hydrolase FlgJ